MENKLLTIYIPIYNRSNFLRRMLQSFLLEKELFIDSINLVISDNCSSENLEVICKEFERKGLVLKYHRNHKNIGGGGNIRQGYSDVETNYIWVLGSDDIPLTGALSSILSVLKTNELGILHLAHYSNNSKHLTLYENTNDFIKDIHIYSTFISDNIVNSKFLGKVDLAQYSHTSLSQLPLYIYAASHSPINGVYHFLWLQLDNDFINNGGYNFFKVFVKQYLDIYRESVEKGYITSNTLKHIKRILFRDFLSDIILYIIPRRKIIKYDLSSSFSIIFREYWNCFYAYLFIIRKGFKVIKNKILK